MGNELSQQTEQFLADIVAGGLYPTREAALEAAVEAWRNGDESLPLVPPEHMDLVEQGLASLEAGRGRVLTDADWDALQSRARQAAQEGRG